MVCSVGCQASEKNKIYGVTRCGEKLVFWRDDASQVHCIFDQCCHRGASLSAGHIENQHVACPFHGFQYDSKGKVVLIPANGKHRDVPENYKVNAYFVKEAYGFIWLWFGDDFGAAAGPIPFLRNSSRDLHTDKFQKPGRSTIPEAIENQLDVVHLPFVHDTTIGRGNRKLVNGPVVKWTDNLMTFYVDNQQDRGQNPKRASEIEAYERLFHLQFQMPNTWQNIISDDIRIVAAFAPIDDEHTHIYIRFYQRFMKIPGLRHLVNRFSNISNRVILHQDRRVVLTQHPKKSELNMGENLIQGDLPLLSTVKEENG
jgi:phenylpropionate dioxygenase-like ring-hydroxylating dioxygenase large terminal subunit